MGEACSADLALPLEGQSWGRGCYHLLVFLNRQLGSDSFHSERLSHVVIQGGKTGVGMNWEIGIDMYTVICLK